MQSRLMGISKLWSSKLTASFLLAFFIFGALVGQDAGATYFPDAVGIGTSTSPYKLSVYSTSTMEKLFQVANVSNQDIFSVDSAGNVGIGTSNATQKLDVAGNIAIGALNCVYANGVCAFKKQAGAADFHFVPDLASSSASNIFIGYNSSAPVSIGGGSYTKPYFIRFNADDNIRLMTAGLDRVRVDVAGNVGIGTVTPNRKLTVNGQLGIQSSGAEYGLLQTTTNGLYVYGGGNGRIIFMSGISSPTEKMRVTETGYLGIGTNTPVTNLSVSASKSLPGQMFELQNTNANDGSMRFYQMQDASGGIISFSGTPIVASAPNGTAFTAITSATQDYPTATRGANFLESVNGNFHIGTVSSRAALFRPLTILNTGNVGIATTTPSEKLEVNGNIKVNGNIVSDGDICIGKCN